VCAAYVHCFCLKASERERERDNEIEMSSSPISARVAMSTPLAADGFHLLKYVKGTATVLEAESQRVQSSKRENHRQRHSSFRDDVTLLHHPLHPTRLCSFHCPSLRLSSCSHPRCPSLRLSSCCHPRVTHPALTTHTPLFLSSSPFPNPTPSPIPYKRE